MCDAKGRVVARGLANHSSRELDIISGSRTSEIEKLFGHRDYDEAVHGNNLVILEKS